MDELFEFERVNAFTRHLLISYYNACFKICTENPLRSIIHANQFAQCSMLLVKHFESRRDEWTQQFQASCIRAVDMRYSVVDDRSVIFTGEHSANNIRYMPIYSNFSSILETFQSQHGSAQLVIVEELLLTISGSPKNDFQQAELFIGSSGF